MNTFKITFEDGDSYETNMNATLEEAERYFKSFDQIQENFETGEETRRRVAEVEQVAFF